ncbi:MAG: hypothetical protein IT320_26785 [Anaerolineae bacterium]|nr:hypothetical protein [Anaerolineae bacterium]
MALTPRDTPNTIQLPFRRRRSFLSDVGQAMMQPRTFFMGLRQSPVWGMAALVIVALITLAEVQALGSASPTTPVDTWATALVAIARVVFTWILQAILLSEVSLFNGIAPQWGLNWRVAVWASLPLGFMAALQMLYRSGGGVIGEPGLAGFLPELPWFETLPMLLQQILRALSSNLTLFWLWHLLLLYLGARFALKGRTWAAILVVVMWVIIVVMLPVITNRA